MSLEEQLHLDNPRENGCPLERLSLMDRIRIKSVAGVLILRF